jgi:4-hydroxybenzoate polyprenyltransferase
MMLKSIIKFARVRIIASCWSLVLLGNAYAGAISPKITLAFVLIVAFIIHANSINDYADRDIDKINLKGAHDRPLLTKDITDLQFWTIHFSSGLVALGLSYMYGLTGIVLTLILLFIDYAYSLKPFRITDRTFLSPLLLAFVYTYYSFSIGFWSVSHRLDYPWLLTFGLSLAFVARILLKDFRDTRGDEKHGKITFLLHFGPRITALTSGLFLIMAMIAVSAAFHFANGVVLVQTLTSTVAVICLRELANLTNVIKQQELVAVLARVANFAMIAILAYLLCRNQPTLSGSTTQLITILVGAVLLVFGWLQGRINLRFTDV